MAKVSLVSLGCPKNLVDSEGALAEIALAGHEIVVDNTLADVIVVNTCGFVESARLESGETIREALEHRRSGDCKAVVVIGCLSQKFGADFKGAGFSVPTELGNADVVMGVDHVGKLAGAIESALSGKSIDGVGEPPTKWIEPEARMQSTPPWTAYLKISDGCSNRCTYCAIPDIRGQYRSRPEDMILREAEWLADNGVKELILIGQDLTQYGRDFDERDALASLLRKLNNIPKLHWIRLMYCYPSKVTPSLIDAIAECDKVVKYIDLPLQHADDGVLGAMNRRGLSEEYMNVIDSLRAKMPEIALRTTFIVGFPGETDSAFENLLSFIQRVKFDKVGAFVYSREEGTPAASMLDEAVPYDVAEQRYDRLMSAQQKISLARNLSFIGRKMEVLVEGRVEDVMFGRSYRDAPEIDGLVYLDDTSLKPGTFVRATITNATEYDLITF